LNFLALRQEFAQTLGLEFSPLLKPCSIRQPILDENPKSGEVGPLESRACGQSLQLSFEWRHCFGTPACNHTRDD
jgi:hypothetical protein